ncbi:fumarylacetoacetate hydrolase family protein [Achromobacter arsenitoxydans]|uniref:2-keto-4-pentenoate hydratase/2-oxohepta-3-ene-1,7-dioic acid hydratase n=1 Tax=Achromobacter arsenitoxydans SY8 TaxID=477184 RepID=H0FCD4_9BURK|nr:fumarylacetoacetate hydrolase family protein [Achromobacter arsenitoxydans]EHK64103.1 2-keto-4-pentenoate hydratase/2-oxohepta-3-ene-1,7-dioic acid hydratase [Achromobacter arsenitoxydans SY8]
MRFVTFQAEDGQLRPGFLSEDGREVVDARHADAPEWARRLPATLLEWTGMDLPAIAARLARSVYPQAARIPVDAVRLAAPLPRPGKVVGAAFNFHDALRERKMEPPAEPVLFIKSGHTVIGPGEPVRLHPEVGNVTYEAELGVVIGRTALRVAREDAMRHVAGYVIVNDVSATDMVKADKGFVRGKNQPTFCPLGPWLVTPDELPNPHATPITLLLDGVLRQQGTTADLVFDIPDLISHASRQMPLDPGDIIATGTPAGVAVSHDPPAWLRPGAHMRVELPGLGFLDTPVIKDC